MLLGLVCNLWIFAPSDPPVLTLHHYLSFHGTPTSSPDAPASAHDVGPDVEAKPWNLTPICHIYPNKGRNTGSPGAGCMFIRVLGDRCEVEDGSCSCHLFVS